MDCIMNNQAVVSPCFFSMKFIESAFEYQKEIMELKQKKAMKLEMENIGNPLAKQNKLLKQRNEDLTKHFQDLNSRLKDLKTKKETTHIRIKELKKLETILVRFGLKNQPIPHDIILLCKQEINAADETPK